MTREIFVFGSNRAGRHGKGAALYARQRHGAIYGQGEGPQGSSYAIPTKDARLKTLPIGEIAVHVGIFFAYCELHHDLEFILTPIGCGLAGYAPEEIAPLFRDAPNNVRLPEAFRRTLLQLRQTEQADEHDDDRRGGASVSDD